MNKLEANYGNFASPAVAPGLELSGPNSEFSQTQELIENAPVIVASHIALEKLKTYSNIIGEQGAIVSRRARRAIGVLVVPVIALAAACGGGSKENADQVSAKPDVPAAPAVVRTLEPTPASVVKAEAPKPNTEVVTSGPTEASKAKVREEMGGKLILISTEISALEQPLYEKTSLELHKQRQVDVAAYVKTINDALAKNDVEAARPVLLQLKDKIYAIGNPLKGTGPDKNMKSQHDPEDKYIKNNIVDPAVLPWYLAVVDMMVATDPTYNGK